jgi:prepilin-type N-terminal cleavage/methylation domain-containing protein
MHDRRRPRRAKGFTLPEIMAVVAIVGVLGAVAMATLNGATSGQNAASLARSLEFAMMNARSSALSDGTQRRLNCTLSASGAWASYCDVEKLCLAGMNPVTSGCSPAWNRQVRIPFGSHATVWNVTDTTDYAANNAGSTQVSGVSKMVTFYPDGSADTTGKTVYVADTNGANKGNQFKIYVYSATGMSRLVNLW